MASGGDLAHFAACTLAEHRVKLLPPAPHRPLYTWYLLYLMHVDASGVFNFIFLNIRGFDGWERQTDSKRQL